MVAVFILGCFLLSATLPLTAGDRNGFVCWIKCGGPFPGRWITSLPDYDARHLDARHCNITHIKQDEFNGLPYLDFIETLGNGMTYIHPAAFKSVPRLKRLILSYNELTEVPVFAENSLPSLTWLELFWNNITGIYDARTFLACVKLEDLLLEFNSIEYLHPDVFRPMTELKTLMLSDNKIRFLPNFMFNNNIKLEWLALSNNEVTFLPVGFITSNFRSGFDGLDFSDNPWQCGCLLELIAEAKRLGMDIRRVHYWESVFADRVCIFSGTLPCRREDISGLLRRT